MFVSIEYCSVWNYLPKASSLESYLKNKIKNIQVELISSGGGVFEVRFNKELIFSKKLTGRFPENSEIVNLIAEKSN